MSIGSIARQFNRAVMKVQPQDILFNPDWMNDVIKLR